MNGRVYDPFLARMISADPTVPGPFNGQAFNRYAYVFNNPLSLVDPSGFGPLGLCGVSPRCAPAQDGSGGIDRMHIPYEFVACDDGSNGNAGCFDRNGDGIRGASYSEPPAPTEQVIAIVNITERNGQVTPAVVVAGADGVRIVEGPTGSGAIDSIDDFLLITGHRVGGVGPVHLAIEHSDGEGNTQWVSGQPINGDLEGVDNGDSDIPSNNTILGILIPPPGVSGADYFDVIVGAAFNLASWNVDYDLFPTSRSGGFNSNGFVSGVISATGGNTNFDFSPYVGGTLPVPPQYFDPHP